MFVFVYVDDILFVGRRRLARQAARLAVRRLRRAGFFISHKSMLDQVRQPEFIGKYFDAEKGAVHNKQGLLVGVIALWLLMNLCPYSHKNMSRLSGRSRALRPNVGWGPFLTLDVALGAVKGGVLALARQPGCVIPGA